MNYQTLKTELQEAKYLSMTDAEATDSLNTKDITSRQSIPVHDIKQYLMVAGVWLGIKQSGTPTAIVAMDALANFESFNVTNPTILGVLNTILSGLVTESTMPDFLEEHKVAILAMGDIMISRAEELGLGTVTAGDIQAARSN